MLFKDLDKMTLEERVIYQGELIKKLYETVPEIFGQIGYHSKVEYNSERHTYDIADIYDIGENKLKVNGTLTFADGSICRIDTIGEKTFTVEYLYNTRGPKGDKGASINGFSTIKFTNRGDNTITEVQAETDTGNFPFEIYAANGSGGGSNVGYVYINLPDTTTDGIFNEQELNILLGSKENKIIFNNEIYLLQDNQHEAGYLIYTHIGRKSTKEFFTKCITVTINTRRWVLTALEQQKQLYLHQYYITYHEGGNVNVFSVSFDVITDSKNPITSNSIKYAIVNNANKVYYQGPYPGRFKFYNVGYASFNEDGTVTCSVMLFDQTSCEYIELRNAVTTVHIKKYEILS